LEIEKEIIPELAEQYRIHADKEKKVCSPTPYKYHVICDTYRWQK